MSEFDDELAAMRQMEAKFQQARKARIAAGEQKETDAEKFSREIAELKSRVRAVEGQKPGR